MTSLRTIVLSSVLLAACSSQDAPAQTKPAAAEAAPEAKRPGSVAPEKRLPPTDPHAITPPGEEPIAREVIPTTKGVLEAMIDGKPAHFVWLSPGQNRAIVLPEGVGRIRIEGSEEDTGLPHLRILVEGLRPDQIQYPITIGSKGKDETGKGETGKGETGKGEKAPYVSVRYEVNENRVYVIDPAKDAEVAVTLEAWEGQKLRGKFEGKLAPTAAGLGAPIPISGKFEVELGVQGVQPGPVAPAGGSAPKVEAPAPAKDAAATKSP